MAESKLAWVQSPDVEGFTLVLILHIDALGPVGANQTPLKQQPAPGGRASTTWCWPVPQVPVEPS